MISIENQLIELIESVNLYMSKIPNGCTKIAEFLRNGQRDEAYNSISNFVEGIEWVSSSFNILKNNNYSIIFNEEKMKSLLLEVNDTLEQRDQNVLADLFEYEIASFFEEESQLAIAKKM
ncbi:hypothetical protein MHH85_16575 [Viridibacillus sp. FSL E2-0187]|uniref:hypothetical protein n=1 Tax=Viridibacillus sp. FSL E2-0187 TaxID=2921362 RepID=UPI0030F7ADFA